MKEIYASQIEDAVCQALLDAHFSISSDIESAVCQAAKKEAMAQARVVLQQITDNYVIAREESLPICQDSGMTMIWAEVGQEVHINGDFETAVNKGVRRAHKEGYLRASVVRDPLFDRSNTKDGTPAIIQVRLVTGDQMRLNVVGKGFGSENCSVMQMFIPATPMEEIENFIVSAVTDAGGKSCPPVIVGVGIGGTMDKASAMAKQATFRSINQRKQNPQYAALEEKLLQKINASGIGPGGLGGKTTALAVNIATFATHIASVPVAVNLCCHASRHATVEL